MSFASSRSKTGTMCRFAGESEIVNTYVPAGRVVPGRETGPLNVTIVLRSGRTPCADAIVAVNSVAAQKIVSKNLIRPISYCLLRRCSQALEVHTAYRLAASRTVG